MTSGGLLQLRDLPLIKRAQQEREDVLSLTRIVPSAIALGDRVGQPARQLAQLAGEGHIYLLPLPDAVIPSGDSRRIDLGVVDPGCRAPQITDVAGVQHTPPQRGIDLAGVVAVTRPGIFSSPEARRPAVRGCGQLRARAWRR